MIKQTNPQVENWEDRINEIISIYLQECKDYTQEAASDNNPTPEQSLAEDIFNLLASSTKRAREETVEEAERLFNDCSGQHLIKALKKSLEKDNVCDPIGGCWGTKDGQRGYCDKHPITPKVKEEKE